MNYILTNMDGIVSLVNRNTVAVERYRRANKKGHLKLLVAGVVFGYFVETQINALNEQNKKLRERVDELEGRMNKEDQFNG